MFPLKMSNHVLKLYFQVAHFYIFHFHGTEKQKGKLILPTMTVQLRLQRDIAPQDFLEANKDL